MATPEENAQFARMEELFHEAMQQDEASRESWLRTQCADDEILLQNTLELLRASEQEQDVTETLSGPAAATTMEPRRLGPFEIISLLGRGGMGAVYLARRADGQYEKQVAIKLVDLPLATEVLFERFRQERQILAGLEHPNIARMLDGGVSDDGVLYLVLEYVEGIPIDEYVRSQKLSLESKLKLFAKVCSAVQFAHQNLVIHRDLKPDNILVSSDGEPHLLDFGTAKLLSADTAGDLQGLTRQGFLSFTPAYASPEQVLGKPITTATDTYSLGVMLYLLLTDHLPYELSKFTIEEMVAVICNQPPGPPSKDNGIFPNDDLEAILDKSLRKEPEQRYGTAQEFVADINAYLEQRPVLAHKGTLRYKAVKFARRNKLAISFAAILVLMLFAGVVAVVHQAEIARRAELRAEARSADLLQLSDSLLSELDNAIQQLPGSTNVQQLLVAQVLEHMERVAADARSDRQTGVILANAYVRLGNLQGDPYEQNIGDTPGAIRSLNKSVSILEPLAASYPKDGSVLIALARAEAARGEILSLSDDNEGGAVSMQAAIASFERLLALTPTPALYFETAVTYETYGDLMGEDTGFADAAAALTNYRRAIDLDHRALAIDPKYARVLHGLPLMQIKLGNVHLDDSPAAALGDFSKGMDLLNALSPEERKSLSMVRMQGLLLRKRAMAFSELSRFDEARADFAKSDAIYSSLIAADAKDLRAKRDMLLLLTAELDCEENSLNPSLAQPGDNQASALQRARDLAERKTQILHQLLEKKVQDKDFLLELAANQVHLFALDARVSAHAVAGTKPSSDLGRLRGVEHDAKASPHDLDLAFSAFWMLDKSPLRDPVLLLACAQRGVSLTHQKSAEWMLALSEADAASGDTQGSRDAARTGLAILKAAGGDTKDFNVRKLLEKAQASGV